MTIAENFLLLALHEKDGTPVISLPRLHCGLAGAVLAELAVAGRIAFEDGAVTVLEPFSVGTPEEDAALARMNQEQPQNLEQWVMSLREELLDRTLARLVEQGILTERKRRILGIVPVTIHPAADPGPGAQIRSRLSLAQRGESSDDHTAFLLALARATGLDREILPQADPGTPVTEGGADVLADAVQRCAVRLTAGVIAGN